MPISRREFLAANAAAALSAAAAPAAQGETKQGALPLAFDPKDPNLKYDLLVAGGTVIDPGQKLHARRDVAIKNGQIAAIEESIAKTRAAQVIDATGNLITPGLVDLH
ncbi:MAG: twin-arginine translocation signal domain-containing protein, partial [Myxococcales bacterium]